MQKKEKKQIGKEIITTSEVTKSFGRFQALKGITAKKEKRFSQTNPEKNQEIQRAIQIFK